MELMEDYVDIIIPFYRTPNGEKNLKNLYESLNRIDAGFPYKIILAEGNKPCVQNRNDGLRQSTSRYFMMCDEDLIFVEDGWLKKAVDAIKTVERCGAVGFHIIDKIGKSINCGRVLVKFNGQLLSIDCIEMEKEKEYADDISINKREYRINVAGCCVLFDRLIAGYFPEKIYPDRVNAEDIDYQMTIQANGYYVYYLGDVKVIHNELSWDEKVIKYGITKTTDNNHNMFEQRWGIRCGRMVKKDGNDVR